MSGKPGEFDLIARHFAPIAQKSAAALSLLDDAAVLSVPAGQQLVITTDALVADVHFRAVDAPDDIGRKVMRVNLSDLAAMGARPLGVVLSAGYGPDQDEEWIAAFARGIGQDCAQYDVPLLGGDTVSTPGPAFFSLTAFGTVATGRALHRNAARPGDAIAVTGTLGDAALGLRVLQGNLALRDQADHDHLCARYWQPLPRLDTGLACAAGDGRIAAMDISDGLAGDCRKICAASGVGMVFEQATIPLSDAARHALLDDPSLWQSVLAGGDDYELLLCAAPEYLAALAQTQPITIIGHVTDQPGRVMIQGPDGKMAELPKGGFDHFSNQD